MKYNCSTAFPPNVCDYPERVLHTFCALARALPAKEYKALRWGLKPQKIEHHRVIHAGAKLKEASETIPEIEVRDFLMFSRFKTSLSDSMFLAS